MLNIQQLKKYLFSHHHIKMKPTQLQTFRNLGYYHGYKGYRFIKKPSQQILFSNFTESLRSKLPINMYNQIISTGLRTKLNLLNTYIVNS